MSKKSVPYLQNQTSDYYASKIGNFFVSQNDITRDYPLHQHEFYELEYIVSGEGTHYINGVGHPVYSGMLIFVTPQDVHGYAADHLSTITCHFYAKDLSGMVARLLFAQKAAVQKKVSPEAVQLIQYMLCVFQNKHSYTELQLRNLTELLLLELFSEEKMPAASGQPDRIEAAIGFINVHFQQEITLKTIEAHFQLSPSYFSREFKKRTGRCFVDYLSEKRLEYAKNLLKNGNQVIDACFESGFGGVRNFNRQFKASFGQTPTEFAKSQK